MEEKYNAGEQYSRSPLGTEVRLVNKEDRIYDFVASTQDEDRHGTRLFGWNLDNYSRNGVILWGHNSSIPPIGRALRTWVDGDVLKIRIQFPPEGVYELADTVRKMVEEDYLRSGSVGFIPEKVVYPWQREEEDGDNSIHLINNELVEYSLTPTPSNPGALQLAMSRGLISEDIEDCFVANRQVDGSKFEEARAAMTEWILKEMEPTADESDDEGSVERLRDLVAEQAALIEDQAESLQDKDSEIESLNEDVERLTEKNLDLHAALRTLNHHIELAEEVKGVNDVARRVEELEHRVKASRVISVDDEADGPPRDFLEGVDRSLDRLAGS